MSHHSMSIPIGTTISGGTITSTPTGITISGATISGSVISSTSSSWSPFTFTPIPASPREHPEYGTLMELTDLRAGAPAVHGLATGIGGIFCFRHLAIEFGSEWQPAAGT